MTTFDERLNPSRREPKPIVLVMNQYFLPAFRGGGPIRTIEALISEHKNKYEFHVFTSNMDLGDPDPLPVDTSVWLHEKDYSVYYSSPKNPRRFLGDAMALCRTNADYVYLNSFFSLRFSILPSFLFRIGALSGSRLIIAPRGELGSAPLKLKAPKKAAMINVSRCFKLHRDAIWHASTPTEKSEILAVFPSAEVVVRENETALPYRASQPGPRQHGSPLRFAYVGRLSEKKGIHLIFEALTYTSHECHVELVGSFEDRRYESLVREKIRRLPSNVSVTERGPLPHGEVRDVFSNSDYFVFPTSHENFGHTVTESLSASCPVIIADVTPFTEVVARGGGLIVDSTAANDWATALNLVIQRSEAEHKESRIQAGRAYNSWRTGRSSASVFELVDRLDFENRPDGLL